jgi:membrane protein DedA with SNARE-associated domain
MKKETGPVGEPVIEDAGTGEVKPPPKSHVKRDLTLGILAVVATIALGYLAIANQQFLLEKAAGYSLLGMLVISFLAGSLLSFTAIPVPYWALCVALPVALAPRWGLLAPVLVGVVSALGATIGHMPTFMIGYSGKSLSESITSRFNTRLARWYRNIMMWSQRHGWIAVFLTSAVPNPIHLPMTVAFGTLKYPPWKFFVYSLLGNCVKSLFLAFVGYFGLTSILKIFGVNA